MSLGGSLASVVVSKLLNSLLVTTPRTLESFDLVIDGQGCNVSRVVITEGTLEYPYFEGMKSVGQDDINGHNIEILSSKYSANYYKNSQAVKLEANFIGSGTSTLMLDEEEKYYRAVADEGRNISLYRGLAKS